jgi:hypothetical protein
VIQDATVARIVAVVWPADITAGAWVLSRHHREVRDVIDGLPVPTKAVLMRDIHSWKAGVDAEKKNKGAMR